jgi:hypothetical protein
MRNGRKGHSLNALGDKYLIATGGRDEKDKYLNSCELFDIAGNEWFDLPPLNIARHQHTGCVVGGKSLYVFCGIKETNFIGFTGEIKTNEIEFLESKSSGSWQNVQVQSPDFSPRIAVGAIETDKQEIFLFGGTNEIGGVHTDAFIFNTTSHNITLASKDTGEQFSVR